MALSDPYVPAAGGFTKQDYANYMQSQKAFANLLVDKDAVADFLERNNLGSEEFIDLYIDELYGPDRFHFMRQGLKEGLAELGYQVAMEVGSYAASNAGGWFVGTIAQWIFKRYRILRFAWSERRAAAKALKEGAEFVPDALGKLSNTPKVKRIFDNTKRAWTSTHPRGTQKTYQVFQRTDIDWSRVRTGGDRRAVGLTNQEAARRFGLAPELNDESLATLHHLGQDANGPLAEASTRYHGVGRPGQHSLHSQFGRNQPHPTNPPDRIRFNYDSQEYWRWREMNRVNGGQ